MRDDIDIDHNAGTVNNRSTIYQWNRAPAEQVAPKILAAAEALLATLPVDTVPQDTADSPGGLHGLAPRDNEFVGREADLRVLAAAIKEQAPMTRTCPASRRCWAVFPWP